MLAAAQKLAGKRLIIGRDIFGGTGKVSSYWRRKRAGAVIVDNAAHPSLDIRDPSVQTTLLDCVHSREVTWFSWLLSAHLGARPRMALLTTAIHPLLSYAKQILRGAQISDQWISLESSKAILQQPFVYACRGHAQNFAFLAGGGGLENPLTSMIWKRPWMS